MVMGIIIDHTGIIPDTLLASVTPAVALRASAGLSSHSRPLNEAVSRHVENHSKNSYGPKNSDLGGRKCILGNYFIEYTSRTSCYKNFENWNFRDPLDQ